MTGRCDICEKIFNSHDGGWICPTCGKVYCPECEVMPDGVNEPLCTKCEVEDRISRGLSSRVFPWGVRE
jgi:hypothetical protein